ncbi:MAG TPA: hypothetical protein ACN46S_09490 [Prochlorococcus sp.]
MELLLISPMLPDPSSPWPDLFRSSGRANGRVLRSCDFLMVRCLFQISAASLS